MELRLLGPVELVAERRSLEIGGPRQRTVLAMLALNANRVTPVEQLIDAVWDDSPPSTARGQIQICVSALRKLFDSAGRPQAIKTRPPGYLLELEPDELDSERFSSLVLTARTQSDAGRLIEAAATLREALAMWRGPALAGVPSDLVQRGAAMLEGRRLAALEERIRLDLAVGRHEEITGELRALTHEYPLHEQLYAYLMLALYRAGRQAEALDVCRRARNTLIEEVGIEPGPELRNLEMAILNRDPSLELPAAPAEPAPAEPRADGGDAEPGPARQPDLPRQLPASIADFTGREAQLAEIKRRLRDDSDPYALRIVAISGKGGVGKSSLAVRAAHELADTFPDGHLYADMHAHDDNDLTGNLLARFLRALGVPGSAIPEDLAERAEMYRSCLAGKRMLLVLDDVVNEEQVLPMLPGSPTCAVITTSRARLSGLPGGHWTDVTEFDMDSSIELLGKIIGTERVRAEPDAAIELVNLCGGLPLALRIAGARLASRPHWRISGLVQRLADKARRLDELAHRGLELRSNIEVTYRILDAKAKHLFRLFALMSGRDFPSWTAAALLDCDLLEAEEVLETLVDAQVIDTVQYEGNRGLRYRFHDLIRVYADEQLALAEPEEDRRAALGRVLGAWLALAEEAHRKEYGGDYTVLHGTAPRWLPPGSEHSDLDSIDNPVEWWDAERRSLVTAVMQAAEAGFDELCWDLALTLVSLFETRGLFDDWRETARVGLEAATQAGNRRGQAAMHYSTGSLDMVQHRLADAQHNFAVALSMFEAENDRHGCALVLRNSAYVDGLRGYTADMIEKYTRSLELLAELGDRIGEAHVLRAMAKFAIDEGDTESARQMLDRALKATREVGSPRGEAQVLHRFAELYLRTDEIELARQALHQVLLIVRDMGDQIGEAYALYDLGIVRYREGRLDAAVTTLRHALELGRLAGERLIEGDALHALGEVSIARGNTAVGEQHLGNALAIFAELGSALRQAKTLTLLAETHSATGAVERARRELDEAIELLAGIDSKEAESWRSRLRSARSALPAVRTLRSSADA